MGRLSRSVRYLGTFTNKEGKERSAFIQWREGKGWMVHDAAKGNALLPTATKTVAELLTTINFTRNGEATPVPTEETKEKATNKTTTLTTTEPETTQAPEPVNA